MPRSREILLPWDSQPQEAVEVNQGSPYAPKSGLWIPERNIVNGAGVTYGGSGSDPTQVVTQSGRALYTSGKHVQTDQPAVAFSALTWVAVIKPTAGPGGAGFSSFFQTGQTTFNWNHAAPSYQGAFSLYNNASYPTCTFTSGFSAGVEVVVGGTYDGTTLKVFRGGRLENSAVAGNGLSGVSLNSLQFLGGVGGTVPFDGTCSYFYWDATRALTDAQMAQLMSDIYAETIEPQTIWVPVSAGGGGTVTLAAQDAAHAHALDNAALSIGVTLTVADLAHGHALDASTLSTGTALAVADAQHAHALDNVTLSTTGATSLTVADLLHAHTLDAVVLTSQTDLAAADMAHGHALDGVTLTLGGISLVIAEIMHAHALDNVALTLDTYLAVADILHAHTIDNVLVSIPGGTLDLILKILVNRQELNPATGTFTLYDDDGVTVLYTTSAWADAAGTVSYSGGALRRIDALF